jgi:hypothetical protein
LDLETGEQVAAFAAHGGEVWSVAFSPDGRSIVTGSEDGDAHIYDCVVCETDEILMRVARERLDGAPADGQDGRAREGRNSGSVPP